MAAANTTALAFSDLPSDGARAGYQAGYLPLAVSVFADRPHVRAQMAEDAAAAGFRLAAHGAVAELIENVEPGLGDVILITRRWSRVRRSPR